MATQSEDGFTAYRLAGVRRFLQTALVIDNEAELKPTATSGVGQAKPARRRSGSVLQNRDLEPLPAEQPIGDFGVATPSPSGHELNAKRLTDAFSEREIICGLYKPEPSEEMVALATKAARHADVVIVDWLLEGGSPARAKQIVVAILKEDRAGNGRLRLITIYTSQPGIEQIAEDLHAVIEESPELKGLFSVAGAVVLGDNARVCVLSKPQTPQGPGSDRVPEDALPDRLLREFSELSKGLLTSFALHSLSAVRGAAHHVISVFKQELDGAFLAHRASINDPDEATELAIDLLVGELQNAIIVDEKSDSEISGRVLDGWVEARGEKQQFVKGDVAAPVAVVQQIVRDGAKALPSTKGTLTKGGTVTDQKLGPANVWEIFYSDKQTAWNRQLEFARLSSFKREAYGRTQLPQEWVPSLTLGCVLKVLGPESDAEKARYAELTEKYYICLQPRCDSVRLNDITGFPFQTGQPASDAFNLVVRDRDAAHGTPILVNSKPGNTVVLKFKPNEGSDSIKAIREGEDYIFEDISHRRFAWLGDIRDLKAQHDAVALAASVQRVGLNEHEWLRLAGQKDIKLPKEPQQQ